MATRLTYTEKWDDEWFSELSLKAKLTYLYVLDQCSNAGIWKPSKRVDAVRLGFDIDARILNELSLKLTQIKPNVYFIPSFFQKQFTGKKDTWRAKEKALAELISYGICLNNDNPSPTHCQPIGDVSGTYPSNSNSNSNSNSKLINNTILNNSGKDEVTFDKKCEVIADIWNDIAVGLGLPSVKQPLSDKRKRKMREPLKELPEVQQWVKAISGIKASDFHLGKNNTGWKADFDWFFQSTKNNYLKMLELYENTKWADDGDEQAGIGSSEKPDEIPV